MSLYDDGPDEIFEGAWGEPASDSAAPDSAAPDSAGPESPAPQSSVRRPVEDHPARNHPAFGPGRDRSGHQQSRPTLPDLDQPPATAEPIVPFSLRDRLTWAGPSAEFFPVIVGLMAVAGVLLAGFGPLGRLASFVLLGTWWVLGISIHVTPEHRLTLHLAEATIIGFLIYWS